MSRESPMCSSPPGGVDVNAPTSASAIEPASIDSVVADLLAYCPQRVRRLAKLGAEAEHHPRLLLPGGKRLLMQRLVARGTPVVVNQWASWCGPCRYEFPFFQRLAQRYQGRVRILGVDSRSFRGGRAWPTTAFYAAGGRGIYTHQGSYRSVEDLDAQIRRYALRG